MDKINDDLFFSCSVDKFSERDVLNDLLHLNYLVDELLLGVISQPLSPTDIRSPLAPDAGVVDAITRFGLTAGQAREYVVDFLLRDSIFDIIHDGFFRAEFYFSGVGSDRLRVDLDRMVLELEAGGILFFPLFFFFLFFFFTLPSLFLSLAMPSQKTGPRSESAVSGLPGLP